MDPQVPLNKGHPGPWAEGWGQVTRQAEARVSSSLAPGSACRITKKPTFPRDVVEGRVCAGRERGPTSDSGTQRHTAPRSAALSSVQASLPITNSRHLCKLTSIESVMPSNHLILCCPFSSCPHSFPGSGFPGGKTKQRPPTTGLESGGIFQNDVPQG